MTSRDDLFVDVDASAVTPVEKTCALDSSAFDVALARRSSNDDDASTSAGAKARRCAAPLDAFIASACVSDDECDALIDAARRAGYTFWHADATRRIDGRFETRTRWRWCRRARRRNSGDDCART